MSLADLVAAVANATKSSAKSARAAVDAALSHIEKTISKGGSVRTPFGTFSLAKRGARQGRNLITGEKLKIPASKTVKFKASAPVRARLNPGRAKKKAVAKKTGKKK
jgi:nucleoid DNA-binding protein